MGISADKTVPKPHENNTDFINDPNWHIKTPKNCHN